MSAILLSLLLSSLGGSYPNQGRFVSFSWSQEWLLLEVREQLQVEVIEGILHKVAPEAILADLRPMGPGRLAIQVPNIEEPRLLAEALIRGGFAQAWWPVGTRGGGLAFFDDQLTLALSGAPDPQALKAQGVQLLEESLIPGVWRAWAVEGDALSRAKALMGQQGIRWAEPNMLLFRETTELPTDPRFPEQWHLQSDRAPGEIGLKLAWSQTRGDPQVVVGVFDSGFDLGHEELRDRFIGGFDALDNDDEPKAECIQRHDGNGRAESCPAERPFRESHGTAVAGIIAAEADNGTGGSGICPECSLYLVRMVGDGGLRSLGNAEVFHRAEEEGVWLINNSWGPSLSNFFPLSTAEREVFDRITTTGRGGRGVLILFASGNESTTSDNNPYSLHPGVMNISASTRFDDYACYSNFGRSISISAPSQGCFPEEEGIGTSDVSGPEGYTRGDFTPSFGGTSASSPVATGAAALLLSKRPNLSAQQLKLILEESASPITASHADWEGIFDVDLEEAFAYNEEGHSLGFGYGRLDLAAAMARLGSWDDLTGALCDDACPQCHEERCAPPCDPESPNCPGSARCQELSPDHWGCLIPQPASTDPGEPCNADCDACLQARDSDGEGTEICTTNCIYDEDCPTGFDCRALESGLGLCFPGTADCGSFFGERCRSRILAVGKVRDYCSCECQREEEESCPQGFRCQSAQCRQRASGLICEPSSLGNFLPICFPQERDTCLRHDQCGPGLFCIHEGCRQDFSRSGCDLCAQCAEDRDCRSEERCLLLPGGLKRCTLPCEGDDVCPADSVCLDLPPRTLPEEADAGSPGPLRFCLNPNSEEEGLCPDSWRCWPSERCFTDEDCAEGNCDDGSCFQPPPLFIPTDAGPSEELDLGFEDGGEPDPAPKLGGSSSCQQGSGGQSRLLLLMLPLLLLRSRR